MESCKRHGIEPFEYLRDVLERLPQQTNRDISAFTPRTWARHRNGGEISACPAHAGVKERNGS